MNNKTIINTFATVSLSHKLKHMGQFRYAKVENIEQVWRSKILMCNFFTEKS